MHPAAIVERAIQNYGRRITIACGFNAFEGIAIAHMAWKIDPGVSVFVLDTGKLHAETNEAIRRFEERYHIGIRRLSPDPKAVQAMEQEHGDDLYRKSVKLRQLCCDVRKVQQLSRALEGYVAWMVGIRNGQFDTRMRIDPIQENNPWEGITKINPCANWTPEEARQYVQANNIPFNQLLERGYGSLACACCTRPLLPGEKSHEGKWFWEKSHEGKRVGPLECGLHTIQET